GSYEREVRDRDDAHARIAPRFSERTKLIEKHLMASEPRLLLELARGRCVEILALIFRGRADAQEPARQRPSSFEWMLVSLNEEHAQLFALHREHDDVDRDRGAREIFRSILGEELLFGHPSFASRVVTTF